MGKKFGKLMKAVNVVVTSMSQEEINLLDQDGQITITIEGSPVVIERADVEIISEDMPGWTVANEGSVTVALDLEITSDLRAEGLAREVVKRIQTFRKDNGFEITDRIALVFPVQSKIAEIVVAFKDYIAAQVLADSISVVDVMPEGAHEFDFEDFKTLISIVKK